MARPFWTDDAFADLERLADYLDQSAPGRTASFLASVIRATEVLDRFPLIGRSVPEFPELEIRELIFQDYRIIYAIADGRPWTLSVIHGAAILETALRGRNLAP